MHHLVRFAAMVIAVSVAAVGVFLLLWLLVLGIMILLGHPTPLEASLYQ